jgi:hypothetical protein
VLSEEKSKACEGSRALRTTTRRRQSGRYGGEFIAAAGLGENGEDDLEIKTTNVGAVQCIRALDGTNKVSRRKIFEIGLAIRSRHIQTFAWFMKRYVFVGFDAIDQLESA